jgi:hypothetical protein
MWAEVIERDFNILIERQKVLRAGGLWFVCFPVIQKKVALLPLSYCHSTQVVACRTRSTELATRLHRENGLKANLAMRTAAPASKTAPVILRGLLLNCFRWPLAS